MYQRNVIASFRDYDDANSAASALSRAGFGDVQIRILPPRTTYARYRTQQIIVSAIVNGGHATAAENILAMNGGAIDLHEDANWGGDRWDDRRGGFRDAPQRHAHERHGHRHESGLFDDLPWKTISGLAVALLSGYALWRGAQTMGYLETADDYPPGQFRRNSRSFRSAATNNSGYPDGDRFRRSLGSSQSSGRATPRLADEADLAWGDHDADDTAPMYDRPAGSGTFQTGAAVRSPSNQGFGSGQNATANDGGTSQVGVGSGSGITEGLIQGGGPSTNLGAGSASGAGARVATPASHGRDTAGTAATRFADEAETVR